MKEEADRYAYHASVNQRAVLRHRGKLIRYCGSLPLDLISGYGYRPARSVITYLLVVLAFAGTYYLLGNNVNPPLDPLGAVVFSITSFHGRGFAPGEQVLITNPLTVLAAVEAVFGLLIEITFIATFTQRFFARLDMLAHRHVPEHAVQSRSRVMPRRCTWRLATPLPSRSDEPRGRGACRNEERRFASLADVCAHLRPLQPHVASWQGAGARGSVRQPAPGDGAPPAPVAIARTLAAGRAYQHAPSQQGA